MTGAGETALAEHRALLDDAAELLPRVAAVGELLVHTFEADGRIYTFGNGGSAVDANHFAEELVGRFARTRRPLPAQSLSVDAAALTCIANDFSFVRAGDVAVAFSTSGRSPNVVGGLAAAREAGATTVLFGGGDGGPAAGHADHTLLVPSASTARIQELHVLFLHVVIDHVDRWAAGE